MDVRRTVRLIVAVPAHQPNIEYAVRHLLGEDPKINPRLVAQVDVLVTDEQYRMLRTITHETLRELRNGPAAVSIDHVVVDERANPDIECKERSELQLTLQIVDRLTPGVWLLMNGRGSVCVTQVDDKLNEGPFLAVRLSDLPRTRLPDRWRNCTAADIGKRVVVIGESAEVVHGVLTGVEMSRRSAFYRKDSDQDITLDFNACRMEVCFVVDDDVL